MAGAVAVVAWSIYAQNRSNLFLYFTFYVLTMIWISYAGVR